MSLENKIKLYVNSLVKANIILSPGETGGFWPPAGNSGPTYSVPPTSPPPPPTSPWESDPSYVPGRLPYAGPYNCDNRPTGRWRVPVYGEFPPDTPQRDIDYWMARTNTWLLWGGSQVVIGTRDARGSDACPSCQSSSHPVCECLDAYTQYDYYSYNYVAGGFGDCIIPPTKQLPSHCPSLEVNGIRSAGTISNYAFSTNGSLGGWTRCYMGILSALFGDINGSNNILGPTYLPGTNQETTTLDDWNRFWQNISPANAPAAACSGDPEAIRLAKMMFEARCFVTEAVTTGACCIPENLGGFYCAEVNSQEECPGQFHPGETCQGIGFDNCGSKDKNDKVSVTQSIADPMGINEKPEALVTQLSTALIKSLRGKK